MDFDLRKIIPNYLHIIIAHDIAPGKVGATVTLASGKKNSLGDVANGEIAKEAGTSIIKTTAGHIVYGIHDNNFYENKINTLSTAKGETYILTLPDNSKVWMNAASSLTYSIVVLDTLTDAYLS